MDSIHPQPQPSFHRVAVADVLPTPWRNGGGQTRELLAWPSAAHWKVRVSVAEIERDGPFSSFPGIDRHFAVLTGAGVQLDVFGVVHTVEPGSPPLAFPGEAAPGCALLDGPTRDLNLMVRREAGRGGLMPVEGGGEVPPHTNFVGLFALEPGTVQIDAGPEHPVSAHQLLWTAEVGTRRWVFTPASPPARAWWLWFEGAV